MLCISKLQGLEAKNVKYGQWCIAKNGGGYTQRGVAKGLKGHCLFVITERWVYAVKKTRRLVYAVYPRIPPNTPLSIAYPTRSVDGLLISLPLAVSPWVDKPVKSVMYGKCNARFTVTFTATGHHHPLTGTKFTDWWQRHVCEQLAQGCYLRLEWPGIELMTFQLQVQHPNHYITKPHTLRSTHL